MNQIDNFCNICGIVCNPPELYATICHICLRPIHTNHISKCEHDESMYAHKSKKINIHND